MCGWRVRVRPVAIVNILTIIAQYMEMSLIIFGVVLYSFVHKMNVTNI